MHSCIVPFTKVKTKEENLLNKKSNEPKQKKNKEYIAKKDGHALAKMLLYKKKKFE